MNCLLSGMILKLQRKEISRDHLVVFFFRLVLLFFNYSLTLVQILILISASKPFFFSCSFDFDLQVVDCFGKVFTWISQNMDTKFID